MVRHCERVQLVPSAITLIIAGWLMLATRATAQDPLSVHAGLGGGYTVGPGLGGEAPGGGWNAVAFLTAALDKLPLELRPMVFAYGRGTTPRPVSVPCPLGGCPFQYYSGTERVVGGSLDVLVDFASGLVVPYLVGGLGPVAVTRRGTPLGIVHSAGPGYDVGAGVRWRVGSVQLFGEGKFFTTNATADRFGGNAVHMLPLTVGIVF
jgi:hypothetical protein